VHRTITSAAVTAAAITGLAGCVTVASPSPPDDGGKPRIVQAPAREALDDLNRSRRRKSTTRRSLPAPKAAPRRETGPRPAQRYVPVPQPVLPRLPVRPVVPRERLPAQPDACALGKAFDQYEPEGQKVNLC
jgi:hypothetical protein